MAKKPRRCPVCNWRYPIAKIAAPGKHRDGVAFDCPKCGTELVFHAGRGKLISKLFALAGTPVVMGLAFYPENTGFRWFVFYVLMPLAIISAFYVRLGESIVLSSDQVAED